ncbi:MAG: alginate export family protein [Sandaracinaceae bacterium]
MRRLVPRPVLFAILAASWLHPAGVIAQAPEGEVEPPPPEVTSPSPLEARIAQLEERDRARDQALNEALSRVDQLERDLNAARDAADEEEEVDEEAPTGPTVRPLASLFTRLEHREGYMALGAGNPGCFPGANDGDCLRYRAEAGLAIGDLRVADEVVAAVRFRPQVSGFWSFGTPPSSGGVVHPALGLYEGNLILQLGDAVRIDAGRIVLNYGDQMVIGALRWHPAGRSFDGARMHVQPTANGWWVDLFWTMLNEGGAGGHGFGDRYFYGAYAALGPLLGEGVQLDAYALGRQQNDSVDPTSGAQVDWSLLVHLGARFRYRVEIVDLRLEGGFQTGRQGQPVGTDAATIIAGHVDGEVGLNLLDDRVRLAAHGFFASGDNPSTAEVEAYDQLFPTAHAFLGWSDVMGARTNVAGGAFHVAGKPLPQLTLSLDVFVFTRPENAGDAYAGTEGDVQVLWLPGAGFRVRGMYALFFPNEGLWGTTDQPVHYIEAEVGFELN